MASYNKAILTNQGIQLLNDLLDGESITFTSLKTGSGSYTDDDKTTDSIRLMTSLKSLVQTTSYSSISQVDDNVELQAAVSNSEISTGYYITELGVYAKIGDGSEVLYCVITTNESDYIPAGTGDGAQVYELVYKLAIKVSDGASVNLNVSSTAYALAEYVENTYLKKSQVLNSGSVTVVGSALDAIQANPDIEGTMAYDIKETNTSLVVQSSVFTANISTCTLLYNYIKKSAKHVEFQCAFTSTSSLASGDSPLLVPTGYRPSTIKLVNVVCNADRSKSVYGSISTAGVLTINGAITTGTTYWIDGGYFTS